MATYLITGANRGIGYEYCGQLRQRGDTAIAVCGTASEELKQRYREAFRKWHQTVLAQMGRDALEKIYRVCYGCDWILIESIFAPPLAGAWWEVLQVSVSRNATSEEVKSAYRTAAKIWHRDINSSPIAKARITALNKAYEEAKASFTSYKYRV